MINLQTTKSYLSRDEMRVISGGNEFSNEGRECFTSCSSNSDCSGECSTCVKSINEPDVGACGT